MKKLQYRVVIPLLVGLITTNAGQAQKFVTSDPSMSNELSVTSGVDLTILCDRSGSMQGDKINQLNSALQFFVKNILNNEVLRNNVQLAIYSFSDNWDLSRPLSKISETDIIPTFSAAGSTNMTDMLSNINDELGADSSRESVIILLTDGEPDNKSKALIEGKTLNSQAFFAPVGVDGANMIFLHKISENAAQLRGLNLGAFFTDLRLSIEDYLYSQATVLSTSTHGFKGIGNTQNWKK